MIRLFLALYLLFLPYFSYSYPTYIRMGYPQCQICHTSSYGGGMLTDYGKGVSAQESFFVTEYQPQNENAQFRHSLQARLINIYKNKKSSVFPMQLDYLNQTRVSEKLSFDFTLGLDKKRSEKSFIVEGKKWYEYFLIRRLFLNYEINENYFLSFGRSFLPIGLNIADHTAFIKSENRRFVTDYNTLIQLENRSEEFIYTGFLFIPSFEENTDNQEYGGGIRAERSLDEKTVLGSSLVYGESQALRRFVGSVFIRNAFTEEFGLLSEFSPTLRKLKRFNEQFFTQYAFFVSPYWQPYPFLQVSSVAEFFVRGEPFSVFVYRIGPSVFFKWHQYATTILDYRYESRGGMRDHLFFAQLFFNF